MAVLLLRLYDEMCQRGVIITVAHAHWAFRRMSGQDLIEYALMAGFVAVAAGAILPEVAPKIEAIFSKIAEIWGAAGVNGG